jgi:hypothetical protein
MDNKLNRIKNSYNQVPNNVPIILNILDEMNDHTANLRNKIVSLFHMSKTNSHTASKLSNPKEKDNEIIR